MVQVIEQSGNIFGQIGKGFGQGLSEQLPKEIDRYRLSSGLKDLKKKAEGGASPLDLLTSAYTIPGITPQMAESIQGPLREAGIRNQAKRDRENAAKNPESGGNPSLNQGGISPTLTGEQPASSVQPQQTNQVPGRPPRSTNPSYLSQFETDTSTLTSPEAVQQALKTKLVPTPDQKDARAFELMDLYPSRYPTFASAEKRVQDEIDTANSKRDEQLKLRNNQLTLESDYDKGFDDQVKKLTQKEIKDLNATIPGQYLDKIKREGRIDVLKGKTPEEAYNAAAKRVLALDKSVNTMRNKIGGRGFFSKNSQELNKDIKGLRQTFADNDALELFKDEQKNYLDQGDHLASHTAWPPSKGLKEALYDVSVNDSPEQIAAKLSDKITEDDSLFSMGYLLNQLGVDDEAVIKELNKMRQEGDLKLDERQDREATEYYPTTFTLGDALWTGFTQTTPLKYLVEKPKVTAEEKFKRRLGGKR